MKKYIVSLKIITLIISLAGISSALLIFNEMIVKDNYIFRAGVGGVKLYLLWAIFTFFIIWNVEKIKLWFLVIWLIVYQLLADTSLLIYPSYHAVVYMSCILIAVLLLLWYFSRKLLSQQESGSLTIIDFCNFCQLIVGIILIIVNFTLLSVTPMTTFLGVVDAIVPLINIISIVGCKISKNRKIGITFGAILAVATIIYVGLHFSSSALGIIVLTGMYLLNFIPNKNQTLVKIKAGIYILGLILFIFLLNL